MSGRIRLEPEERPTEEPRTEPPQRLQEPPEPPPPSDSRPEPQAAPEPTSSPERPSESQPPTEPEQKPPAEDWEKRLARETREKWDARRRAELAEANYQQLQQQLRQQQPQPGQPQADAVEQAKQQLRYEQQAQDFNARCDALYTKGRDEFGGDDMDQAVAALKAVGYGTRPDALAALVQLPNGHRVYRELASDLDRAGRILQLPPMAMAQEFAVMNERFKGNGAEQPVPRAPVTRAPAPLTPVGGNSARPERPLSEVSMAEYIRRRDRDERGSSRIRR